MLHSTLHRRTAAASTTPAAAVMLRDVRKVHGRGDGAVVALDGVSARIVPGSFTALMGPSGSGKSTFLNVAAGLDRPTSGTVALGDTDLAGLSERRLTILRRERIGFVFQAFNLLPYRTALENVMLAELYNQTSRSTRLGAAAGALTAVGLGHRLDALPTTLSGGECQRVAIARALVNGPSLLLCDEPTGNLDSRNAASLMELLDELNSGGLTIVIITHDAAVAAHAGRTVTIRDGILAERIGTSHA